MILMSEDADGVYEYEIFGDAPIQIYLFQGYGGSLKKWNKQFIDNLSRHFEVITFNYPAIGNSIYRQKTTSFKEYDDFFTALLLKLNRNKKFVLFGFSMGVYVIRHLLCNRKEILPEKVILCSGAFGGDYRIAPEPEIMSQLRKAGNDNLHLFFKKENLMSFQEYMNSYVHPTEEHSSAEILDSQANLIFNFFKTYCEDKLENKIHFDTLILHGLNDLIFPKKNAEILKTFCINRCELIYTEGGHAQLFEYPNVISDAIVKFCL